jgi:hypothetical protein
MYLIETHSGNDHRHGAIRDSRSFLKDTFDTSWSGRQPIQIRLSVTKDVERVRESFLVRVSGMHPIVLAQQKNVVFLLVNIENVEKLAAIGGAGSSG